MPVMAAGIPAWSPASASLASRSASDTTPITLRFSSMTGNALTRYSRSRAAISLKDVSRRTAATSPVMTSLTFAFIVILLPRGNTIAPDPLALSCWSIDRGASYDAERVVEGLGGMRGMRVRQAVAHGHHALNMPDPLQYLVTELLGLGDASN